MIGQINTGCALPFFTNPNYQTRYFNDEGYRIIASALYLLPFQFWIDEAPNFVTKFQLVNVDNGYITDLNTNLIQRKRLASDAKTWYFFTGVNIGQILECGNYYIIVRVGEMNYYSDVINIRVIGIPETFELSVGAVSSSVMEIVANHTVNTVISRAKVAYQVNGLGDFTIVPTSITGGDTVTWNMPIPIPDFGAWYKVKYLTKSNFNVIFERVFTLKFSSGDPAGTAQIEYLTDNISGVSDLFLIDIDHSTDYGNVIYSVDDVSQQIYLEGSFGFPEVVRNAEFEQNGNGVSSPVFTQTRLKPTLNLINIPDQFIQLLSDLNAHDSVTITDMKTGKVYTNVTETEFALADQEDGYYSKGVLRFQSDYAQKGSCGENLGVVNI
jgi:hypothetical protein